MLLFGHSIALSKSKILRGFCFSSLPSSALSVAFGESEEFAEEAVEFANLLFKVSFRLSNPSLRLSVGDLNRYAETRIPIAAIAAT